MIVSNVSDVEKLQALGDVARGVLNSCLDLVVPGASGTVLSEAAEEMFVRAGVEAAPPLAAGFPAPICVSVNSCVAHGVPDDTPFEEGDTVNVDVSVTKEGLWVDTGLTTFAGGASDTNYALQQATILARTAMIHAAQDGVSLYDIADTCQRIASRYGYQIIRNYGGHGTGDALHTEPFISNYPPEATEGHLSAGQVIAIEPILSLSSINGYPVEGSECGIHTDTQSAQAEHTIIVPESGNRPIFVT